MARKRNPILLAAAVVAALLVFSVVYAERPGPQSGEMGDELSLTDQQVKEMREIQYNFRKTSIGLRADLKEARLELRHQMMQESTDEKEIAKLVDQVAEAQKRVLKNEVERKLAMKEVLTPEQFEKFMQMRREFRRERMGTGRESRRGHLRGFRPHGKGFGF
jgi:Spy/CpxP family protein refolding chaperone